jgi:hypothetical protein
MWWGPLQHEAQQPPIPGAFGHSCQLLTVEAAGDACRRCAAVAPHHLSGRAASTRAAAARNPLS